MTAIAFQIHNSPPLGYILAIQRRVAVTYTRMISEAEEQAQRAVANGAKEVAR